ncbi:hypothetical protein O0I10_010429 [Lichtheimia ornata]|uniref:Uncharacterized protein n=1 Tax=Lichtheimia ornata TaxID=688661 RepID=A0AAD7UUT3_9FUNG|nr:uncharacterized protein O0I10_010429 [Lichtheimia ornata]KAJ8653862.1 hypothetical protein O0I10_010429 [Lichtheimia ornata]
MSKSKWANLFTRSATDDEASNPRYDRRPSHASSCCSISTAVEDAWSDTECCTKKHKHGSNTRTRLIPSLFRRRGSNTSTSSSCSSFDTEEQETCERDMRQLKSLLDLALDEIKYAEDSRGSSYYAGDCVTAREAIDLCAITFMQLQQQTMDPAIQSLLQSDLAPRLIDLQAKFDALPSLEVHDA